jgi:hypothetical protein
MNKQLEFSCVECKKHFYAMEHGFCVSFCKDKQSEVSRDFAMDNHFCCEKDHDGYYHPGHA